MNKIVDFTWCLSCKHYELSEDEKPCCDCLNESSNEDSHRPVKYERES